MKKQHSKAKSKGDPATYVPRTDEEKAEAFALLDALERELAREEALRSVLSELLPSKEK